MELKAMARSDRTSFDFKEAWEEGGTGRSSRQRSVRGRRGRRRGGGGATIKATPLTIHLDKKKILPRIGDAMVERMQHAIRTTRAKPKESTIERRGPGDLFNVTGRFVASITWKFGSQGDIFLVDPTDRLGPGRLQYLFSRIREARHDRILAWLRRTGRLDELLKSEIIEEGFTRKGTGIPKGRLGGIVRRRR